LSSDKVTRAPPRGAGLVKVTVPTEVDSPVTLVSLITSVESSGGLLVGVPDCVSLKLPVTVNAAHELTVLDAPAVTVVLAGVVADRLLPDTVTRVPPAGPGLLGAIVPVEGLASVTLTGVAADGLSSVTVIPVPPVGAGERRFTVPVEEVPPDAVAGFKDMDMNSGGLIVRVAI
jgi:hypothetical protein